LAGIDRWRECFVFGIFMNCKGLVEIIILNIGLDAGVLNSTCFTIMILLALITTFITTPLALWVFPKKYWGDTEEDTPLDPLQEREVRVLLFPSSHRHLAVQLMLYQLLLSSNTQRSTNLHQFRLFEITERQTSVQKAMLEQEEKGTKDPIARDVSKFAKLNKLKVRNHFGSTDIRHMAEELITVVEQHHLNFIFLSWSEPTELKNFTSWRSCDDALDDLFDKTPVDVGLLIEPSALVSTSSLQIILFYRPGSPDDQAALKFVLKLGSHAQIRLVEITNIAKDEVALDLASKQTEEESSRKLPPIIVSDASSGRTSESDRSPASPPSESVTRNPESFKFPCARTPDQIEVEIKKVEDTLGNGNEIDQYKQLTKSVQSFSYETMDIREFDGTDFVTTRNFNEATLFILGRSGASEELSKAVTPLDALLGSLCTTILRGGVLSSVLLYAAPKPKNVPAPKPLVGSATPTTLQKT